MLVRLRQRERAGWATTKWLLPPKLDSKEGGNVFRNASRARIIWEIEDPLRRLRTDYSISIKFIGPIHL